MQNINIIKKLGEKRNICASPAILIILTYSFLFLINIYLKINNLAFYWSIVLDMIDPIWPIILFVLIAKTISLFLLKFFFYRSTLAMKNYKFIELFFIVLIFLPLIILALSFDKYANFTQIQYFYNFLPVLNNYYYTVLHFNLTEFYYKSAFWYYNSNLYSLIICSFFKEVFFDGISLWLSWLTLFIYYILYCNKNKHIVFLKVQKSFIYKTIVNVVLECIIILMLICFLTKNIYIFFIAFESILLPLVIYITFYGSRLDKITAIKYLVTYTIVGSIFLWLAIAYIIENIGTTNYDSLQWLVQNSINSEIRKLLFLFIFIGFSFKIPMVPFHHWLISAHVEAPTNGSIVLAALLLKVGGYGIYRFAYNIFPLEVYFFSNELLMWSVFGYVFATVQAIRQIDIKRYIAYTSIAHMNFSLVGLFTNSDFGIAGFIHTMLSHGIISTAMFYIIGYIYSNLAFRDNLRLSGICKKMPKLASYFFIFSVANIGLPLFSGFPGEFYILISIIDYNLFYAIILVIPFMLTGYYNFYQINKIIFNINNTTNTSFKKFYDISGNAEFILWILFIWCLILGIIPDIVFLSI